MVKRENGFAVVIGVVLVAIIAAGLAAWFIWSRNDDNVQDSSKNPTPNSQVEEQTQTSEEKKLIEEDKYLVIKEWNLRITLPENLRGDISYFINDIAERKSGGPLRIDFLSKKFSEGDTRCSIIEKNTPRTIVGFYREKVGDSETTYPAPFKTVNEYRYIFITSSCEEAINKENSTEGKKLVSDLKTAIEESLEVNPE